MSDMIKGAAQAQADFMNACRQRVELGQANGELANLYVNLMKEEVIETVEAWNDAFHQAETGDADLIEITAPIVDGAIDTIFVALGLLNALGVDAEAAWQEVCRSNQSKLGPNPTFRADGKLLKDEHFSEPDFARVVRESWGIA
jgi:predicted HAD superfamily Cof-like phosphohydrolase